MKCPACGFEQVKGKACDQCQTRMEKTVSGFRPRTPLRPIDPERIAKLRESQIPKDFPATPPTAVPEIPPQGKAPEQVSGHSIPDENSEPVSEPLSHPEISENSDAPDSDILDEDTPEIVKSWPDASYPRSSDQPDLEYSAGAENKESLIKEEVAKLSSSLGIDSNILPPDAGEPLAEPLQEELKKELTGDVSVSEAPLADQVGPICRLDVQERVDRLAQLIVTTTPMVQDRSVKCYLGIVSTSVFIRAHTLQKFLNEPPLDEVVSIRSSVMEKSFEKAKIMALAGLKIEASRKGADAVVALVVDQAVGQEGIWLHYMGTAVRFTQIQKDSG